MSESPIMTEPKEMWHCQITNCGYIYNPERGDKRAKIPPGTEFESLPNNWHCPVCGASKKSFKPLTDS